MVAVAHEALVIANLVVGDKQPYPNQGPDHFDRLNTKRIQRHHINWLRPLGYEVEFRPHAD